MEKNMKTKKTIKFQKIIKTVKYIPVTDLIPLSIPFAEIWPKIVDEDFPFNYGNNNYSLVSPIDFAVHCEEKLDDIKYKKLLKKIRSIPQDVYIDLEN
jgi:hypothetical protein